MSPEQRKRIDDLLRNLWLEYRAASDQPESLTDEDLDLWDKITRHAAIQSRLQPKPKKLRTDLFEEVH